MIEQLVGRWQIENGSRVRQNDTQNYRTVTGIETFGEVWRIWLEDEPNVPEYYDLNEKTIFIQR